MNDSLELAFQKPEIHDANKIWKLIKKCKPLDTNSEYLYLLLCQHFNDTCIVAKNGSEVIGFVSGYIIPNRSHVLFIWQVAVSEEFRNKGIAKKMILDILKRQYCNSVSFVEATVTPSNEASYLMLESVGEKIGSEISRQFFFGKKLFENENHEPEDLVTIGPLKRTKVEVNP